MGNKRGARGAIPPQGGTTVGAPAKCVSILWGRAPRNFWYFWLQKYEENVPRYAAGISSPLAKDEAQKHFIYLNFCRIYSAIRRRGRCRETRRVYFYVLLRPKVPKVSGGTASKKRLPTLISFAASVFVFRPPPNPPLLPPRYHSITKEIHAFHWSSLLKVVRVSAAGFLILQEASKAKALRIASAIENHTLRRRRKKHISLHNLKSPHKTLERL